MMVTLDNIVAERIKLHSHEDQWPKQINTVLWELIYTKDGVSQKA